MHKFEICICIYLSPQYEQDATQGQFLSED